MAFDILWPFLRSVIIISLFFLAMRLPERPKKQSKDRTKTSKNLTK